MMQKNLQICIDHIPNLSSYKASKLDHKQPLLNMIHCEATQMPYTIHHLKSLRRTQLCILLKFSSHSFHYCYSYIALLLYEGSTFEQKLKIARYNIDFQLSSTSFKYVILKYLASQLQYKSLYITITEINTNMYEYAVNKHACPTDVTLQSVAI